MADLFPILVSVVVSLVSFIGILFVGLKEASIGRLLMILVGFSSGSLIGAAFIDILPEALEVTGEAIFYYVIVGIVFFFAMEKFLYWRHCHDGKCPVHMFAYLNLIGDGVHNFIDGVAISASFLVSSPLALPPHWQLSFTKSHKSWETSGYFFTAAFKRGKR